MKIVKQSVEILTELDSKKMLRKIEKMGRIAWKSEKRNPDGEDYEKTKAFIRVIMNAKHESVIEHESISFIIITNRAIANEIVRHRIASYTQVSTRYYNHNKKSNGKHMVCIKPLDFKDGTEVFKIWERVMRVAEESYVKLRKHKVKPEDSRGVLPLDLATEIGITMNFRSITHFINLRGDKSAHPQVRELAKMLLIELHSKIDVLFDDLYEKYIK